VLKEKAWSTILLKTTPTRRHMTLRQSLFSLTRT